MQARKPGLRPAKLDHHTDSDIFLSFTATDSNVHFHDDATGLIKPCTHVNFDEAHLSVPARKAPLAAEALQRLGYSNRESWTDDVESISSNALLIKHLPHNVQMVSSDLIYSQIQPALSSLQESPDLFRLVLQLLHQMDLILELLP